MDRSGNHLRTGDLRRKFSLRKKKKRNGLAARLKKLIGR
jgi:hypothetical protein